MTEANSAATTAATILGALGEAGTKLGASGGTFGTVAAIAGGALTLASALTLAFGADVPITIPELKDGLDRMLAEDGKADGWIRSTFDVDMNEGTKKTPTETPRAKANGVSLPGVDAMVERAKLAHRFAACMVRDMAAARRAVIALEKVVPT